MNNNGNKTGINNATNANVNNYNTNYFNYMNNVSSQVRPQQQQQGINNNVTNPYPFMYNHGNYNNINTNDPNKISNNNSNINNVAGNATTSGPNINTDEKTNNQ